MVTKTALLIKRHRAKKGISQKELAELLGFSVPQFVSNWERSTSLIPKKQVLKVSGLLDIPEERFIKAFKEDAGEWAWQRSS